MVEVFFMQFNVLWTGGLDSTYRLCQLARQDVVVQPVYVVDKQRVMLQNELKAQNVVMTGILNCPSTKAFFLPVLKVEKDLIPVNSEIEKYYRNFVMEFRNGHQFHFLSTISYLYDELELCQEQNDGFVSRNFTKHQAVLVKDEFGRKSIGDSGDFLCRLFFSKFKFPILDVSRKKMLLDLKEWKYDFILKDIFFCQSPIDDKPCGLCINCQMKILDGLTFLFDKTSLHRAYMALYLRKVYGISYSDWFYRYYFYGKNEFSKMYISTFSFIPNQSVVRKNLNLYCNLFRKVMTFSTKRLLYLTANNIRV